jgi:hypothetical protein
VRIGDNNAGCTMFRGSVKSTGYPLHSPVSPSLPFPCVTVCHHVLTGVYFSAVQVAFVYHSLVEGSTSVHFSVKNIPLQAAKKHIS